MTAPILDMHVDKWKNNADGRATDPDAAVRRERAADWATVRLWGSTNGVPLVGNRRGLDSGMIAAGQVYRVENR